MDIVTAYTLDRPDPYSLLIHLPFTVRCLPVCFVH